MFKRKAEAKSTSAASPSAATTEGLDVSVFEKRSKFVDEIHTHLICSITHELMVDPVVAEDGNTYERSAIEQWIKQKGTSPLNRDQTLHIKRLNLNRSVLTATTALIESGGCAAALANSWRESKKKADLALSEIHFTKGRMLEAAKLGHSKAQGVMAKRYCHGSDGVTKNLDQCFFWASKAAEGEGTVQDTSEALRWYERVASSPESSYYGVACHNIGCIYEYSGDTGRRREYSTSATWFQKGAEAGYTAAQLNLAARYKDGRGIKIDLSVARSWFAKAAAQDNAEALFELGKMEKNGEGGSVDYFHGITHICRSSQLGHEDATAALQTMANSI